MAEGKKGFVMTYKEKLNMEMTIWKFELETTDKQTIEMPVDSEILTVQTQNGEPCLWALVDPAAEKETRTFEVFGTGHTLHYDMGITKDYIGTYQLNSGALVFHVFEHTGV